MQTLWGSSFFSKCLKFHLPLKNERKKWEKVFCFWDNIIWIGIVKLSLWRTGNFSSTTNVLTSSPKILRVNKREFIKLNWLGSHQSIWERCCDADFNSAWAGLPSWLSKGPLKSDFSDIYLTTFTESVISRKQNLWEFFFFFSKCFKFNLNFKNSSKNREKVFRFCDNCISIGIVKLPVLITG